MSRSSISSVLVLVCLGAFAPSAFAQNAQIAGVVRDSSGGVIPGVTVTARNADTGFDACRGH
jgi:hypothetical protein